jgi:glycerophosphoryl diester phosphodiesterase
MIRMIVAIVLAMLAGAGPLGAAPLIINSGDPSALPPFSLPAYTRALEQGAGAIHVPVVMSKDEVLYVLDEQFIAADHSLSDAHADTGNQLEASFAGNYTSTELDAYTWPTGLRPPYLREVLSVVALFEQETGEPVTLFIELKNGWQHRPFGRELVPVAMAELSSFSYPENRRRLIVGSYDADSVTELRKQSAYPPEIVAIVQLIGANDGSQVMVREPTGWGGYNFDWMVTRHGLKALSSYVDMLGLSAATLSSSTSSYRWSTYLEDSRLLGVGVLALDADAMLGEAPRPETIIKTIVNDLATELAPAAILTAYDRIVRQALDPNASAPEPGAEPGGSEIEDILRRLNTPGANYDNLPTPQ